MHNFARNVQKTFILCVVYATNIKRDNIASSAVLTKTTTTAKNSVSMVKELRRNQHNAFSHAKCFSNRCDNNSVKTPCTQSAKHYDTRHIKRRAEQTKIAGGSEGRWIIRILNGHKIQKKRHKTKQMNTELIAILQKETASSSTSRFSLNATNNLCSHIIIENALIHIITDYVGIDEARKSFIPVSVCLVHIGYSQIVWCIVRA